MEAIQPTTTKAPRKQNIFKQPEHQAFFDKHGYLMWDFLDPQAVDRLKNMFEKIMSQERDTLEFTRQLTYYISIFDKDVAMKKEVDRAIKEAFQNKIQELFVDYRILYCNFMAKRPGSGEIQVHQDNTFVDEDQFTAFNVWVPLEDTMPGNGCFHCIPGSHNLLNSYRAGSVRNNLTTHNEMVKKYMTPMPMEAGRGLLFDHKLFHYSPDNHSSTWRPAAQLVLIPNEAQPALAFYDQQNDPDHIQMYKIDDAYLIEQGLWQPPVGLELFMKKKYEPLPSEQELTGILNNHLQHFQMN